MWSFFYLKNKMSSEISNTAKRNEADRHRQKNLFQTMLARPEIGPLGVMLLLFGMLGYFSIPEGQFSLNPFSRRRIQRSWNPKTTFE